MKGAVALRAGAVACALGVTLLACGEGVAPGSARPDAQVEAEIRATLEAYLPVLAEAYATGDVEALRPWAVERVMGQVEKRIVDMMGQGLVLEAEFHDLVIEELTSWGNDFALATTIETWDLRYYSTGGHVLVSERLGVKSRVSYQLKVLDGEWRIFHRTLNQEFDEDE